MSGEDVYCGYLFTTPVLVLNMDMIRSVTFVRLFSGATDSVSGHARTSVAACVPAASPRWYGVCYEAALAQCCSVSFLLPPN